MAIPALRFKALDGETNVGTVDITSIKTSDIFTSANNALKQATDDLKGLLSTVKQTAEGPLALLKSASDTVTRATQDIFSGLKDITGLTPKMVEGQIASLLPNNPIIQNAFKSLTSQCKNGGLNKHINNRGFKDRFGCGSGKGKCASAEINGLLNKLTNGALGDAVKGLNSALQALVALANMGYDIGLCKVFQSLVDSMGISNNVASRGLSSLLGQLSASGNTRGVIDLAASSAGLFPLLENPGAIGQAVGSYSLGLGGAALGGLGLSAARGLVTRFDAGMEILQDGWRSSSLSGVSDSLLNTGMCYSSDFSDGIQAEVTSTAFDPDDLGDSTPPDLAAFGAAYDDQYMNTQLSDPDRCSAYNSTPPQMQFSAVRSSYPLDTLQEASNIYNVPQGGSDLNVNAGRTPVWVENAVREPVTYNYSEPDMSTLA